MQTFSHYNSGLWRLQISNIKVESASVQLALCLPSPPSSPLPFSSVKNSAAVSRLPPNPRRSVLSSALSQHRRTRTPYSRPLRSVESSDMSNPYGAWPPSGVKSDQSQAHRHYSGTPSRTSRRSGSSDQQTAFGFSDSFPSDDQYRRRSSRHTPSSSSIMTSSLSGAMGDINVPPRASGSPPAGMVWTTSPTSALVGGYAGVTDDGTLNNPYLGSPPTPLTSGSTSFLPYDSYNAASYPHDNSNQPHPSGVPSSGYGDPFTYSRQPPLPGNPALPSGAPAGMPMAVSPAPTPSSAVPFRLEEEVHLLRNRVRELERTNKSAKDKVKVLELEIARAGYGGPSSSQAVSGLPSPMPTPSFATSQAFQESWRTRTSARIKLYCSLNRAGNALCAWHDSRRERRAYPPRMAPPGHLNCGCTYEEALFEESLSRHGVGSYLPGESVRMDPALRNPLLKLLKERYGYRDGDFERDPITGNWVEGEGPVSWEAQVASGATSRRHRGEPSR